MPVFYVRRPSSSFRVLVLAILFICTSTFLFSNFDLDSINGRRWRLSMPLGSGIPASSNNNNLGLHSSSQYRPPNITIIAIWSPKVHARPPPYLPNFFASFRANPQIQLLFVVFDKFRYGCDKRISPVEQNIHEICFDTVTYWHLHMDFLCEYWGCTEQDKIPLLQTLVRRGNDDWINSYFRPFRAGVFAKWIDPRTLIWGWCDMDIMLGNFDRKFPWDVAHQFDLIIPASRADYNQIMLFMRGHLMFFRHDKRVTNEFLKYPALRSLQSFLDAPDLWINRGAEEADYSHFALLNSNLTFMHFHAMVWTSDHLSTVGGGVYAIEHPQALHLPSSPVLPTDVAVRAYLSSLVTSRRVWVPPPTFSLQGMEYAVNIYGGKHLAEAWFPKELIVHYEPDYNKDVYKKIRQDMGARYVMRRAINGPVTERVEPPDDIITRPLDDIEGSKGTYTRDNRPFLLESLYIHYQAEKYKPWWALPKRPLEEGEILYMNVENGAQAWNEKGEPWWTNWAKIEAPASGVQP